MVTLVHTFGKVFGVNVVRAASKLSIVVANVTLMLLYVALAVCDCPIFDKAFLNYQLDFTMRFTKHRLRTKKRSLMYQHGLDCF